MSQPDALRLADAIVYATCHDDVGIVADAAAAELRRQHEEIERLRALKAEMLEALKLMCHRFLDTEGSHGQLEHEATEAANAAIAKAEASNGQ